MRRWPAPPPADAVCDAAFPEPPAPGRPTELRVRRCSNLAVETCMSRIGFEMWLCKSCADAIVERNEAKRNPGTGG